MQVIPLSKFRTNQTATLLRAIQGESVFLTSRIGDFKLVPVSVEEKIAILRGKRKSLQKGISLLRLT